MNKIFVLFLSLAFCGCYYDHADELYGGTCETTNVTYINGISEMMNRYSCVSCHSGSVPSGNILLSTYADVKAVAASGRLWGAINHLSGFTPMPQGSNKMSQCDINKVKAWIDASTPQ